MLAVPMSRNTVITLLCLERLFFLLRTLAEVLSITCDTVLHVVQLYCIFCSHQSMNNDTLLEYASRL